MTSTNIADIGLLDISARTNRSYAFASRSVLYIVFILTIVLASGAYGLREYGIFGCSASGYGSDDYLAYCNTTSYADYDHGAIWFELEPAVGTAITNAQVLFLGNSRTQFGFSSRSTAKWFSSIRASYYLLGFSHSENYTFEAPLLLKLHPRAKVYVINIDSFFDQSETEPGKTVMRDESAQGRYIQKRQWQTIHKSLCTDFPAVCGNQGAFFRSRATGAWLITGGPFPNKPVSYNENLDAKKLASYTALGKEFLQSLPPNRACTILTTVPKVNTDLRTAQEIALDLGLSLVAPRLAGLMTFDEVHLNQESSERWSAAFFEEAGPQIRKCLSQ